VKSWFRYFASNGNDANNDDNNDNMTPEEIELLKNLFKDIRVPKDYLSYLQEPQKQSSSIGDTINAFNDMAKVNDDLFKLVEWIDSFSDKVERFKESPDFNMAIANFAMIKEALLGVQKIAEKVAEANEKLDNIIDIVHQNTKDKTYKSEVCKLLNISADSINDINTTLNNIRKSMYDILRHKLSIDTMNFIDDDKRNEYILDMISDARYPLMQEIINIGYSIINILNNMRHLNRKYNWPVLE